MWYPISQLTTIQLIASYILSAAFGSGAPSWNAQLMRGNLWFDRGLYREAIAEYECALPLADSPQNRAVTLYRLALTHGKLAEFTPAERYYADALSIFRAQHDSPKLALALAGLGEIHRAEYRLDDALATEQHALRILKLAGMGETQQAAAVLIIAGGILHDQHRFKAAEHYIREALIILEKTTGPDHPDFAMSLNNLGVVEAARKHPAGAEALLTRALSIREAQFGSEHPLVASTLLSLSWVFLEQKRYAEADRVCRRSIEVMSRFLPANHPDLIKARIVLALIAHRSGDSSAAIGLLGEAVRSLNPQGAAGIREYAQLLNLYSQYLREAGERDKARQFRREAQQLLEQHSETRDSTVTLTELEASSLH